jgi:hypothetical protein
VDETETVSFFLDMSLSWLPRLLLLRFDLVEDKLIGFLMKLLKALLFIVLVVLWLLESKDDALSIV